jgi:hypothetical protein
MEVHRRRRQRHGNRNGGVAAAEPADPRGHAMHAAPTPPTLLLAGGRKHVYCLALQ